MHFIILAAAFASAVPPLLGQTSFDISCNHLAYNFFQTGLQWMHLFASDDAKDAFDNVLKADPNCKMAYYGLAMIQKLPLWHSENVTAASEYLANLNCQSAKECSVTVREYEYIQSCRIYFAKNVPVQDRERNYSLKMKQIANDYPLDVDAGALYALSLLAESQNAPQFISFDESNKMIDEARLVLEKYLKLGPNHPGILHYFSHAYDVPDPKIANFGLLPGKHLQEVASSSTHAIHMASHITLSMGNWTDSLQINRQAYEVAVKFCETKFTNPVDIEFCDRENKYHALEWVHYTLLMQCRREEAMKVVLEFQNVLNRNPNVVPYQDWMLKMYSRQVISSSVPLQFIPANHDFADSRWLPKPPSGIENNSYWDIFAEAGALYARGMDLIKLDDLAKTDVLTVIDQKLLKLAEKAKDITYIGKYTQALQLALKACAIRLTCLPGDIACLSQSAFKWNEALAVEESNVRDATSPTLPIEPVWEAYGRFILQFGYLFEAVPHLHTANEPSLQVAVDMFKKSISVWGPRPASVFGLLEARKRLDLPIAHEYSEFFINSIC